MESKLSGQFIRTSAVLEKHTVDLEEYFVSCAVN